MSHRLSLSTLAVTVLLSLGANAWAEESGSAVSDTKEAVKEGAHKVGEATRDTTRAIGHGTRDAAKAIGHGTRDTVHAVGDAVKDAWQDLTGSDGKASGK